MDLGGREGFYAPNCMVTPDGHRVMWGWITGGGTENYPWNGMLSIPRIVTLRKDGSLGMRPAQALEKLRGSYYGYENIVLQPDEKDNLEGLKGDCLEIIIEFDLMGTPEVGIELLVSSDGEEKTTISYDNQNLILQSGDKQGSFQLLPEEDYLKLHIFLDKSVIEVFANYRECLTVRAYPEHPDSKGIRLFSKRREAKIKSLDIWEINSIWIDN
jgi:beta-fructofuranosidase